VTTTDEDKIASYLSEQTPLTEEDLAKLNVIRPLDDIRADLAKEKDPKRQAELLAELYEAMDEYSMDVAEQAWSNGAGTVRTPSDMEAKTKARLSPRNLPVEEAPEGIRDAEDALMSRLSRLIDRAIAAMKRRRGASIEQVGPSLADIMRELRSEYLREGMAAVRDIYRIGQRAERPIGPFTGRDESVVRFLQEHPDELAGQLSKVVADETGILAQVVRESIAKGIDTTGAIDKATQELDETRWKVERVVRSATSSIVNKARITQIEAKGPGELVDVIISRDERTCPECIEAETHNPWAVPALRARTKGRMTFHASCRCTVARHIA